MSDTYTEKLGATVIAIIVLGLLGSMTTCVATGIRRDRAFENACRKAGGYVGATSTISGGQTSGKDVCLEVVTPPVSKPISLPGYTP